MHRVLTRGRLGRTLRSRWLFGAVVLAMVLGTVVLSQIRQQALAADTRGATEAVSVSNANAVGSRSSDSPSISANGRFVAFRTNTAFDPVDAMNDDSPATDSDIYVRDTVASTTTLITETRDGSNQPAPSVTDNFEPSISATGRYIAFVTADPFFLHAPSTSFPPDTVAICDRGAPNASGAFGSTCTFTSLLAGVNGFMGGSRVGSFEPTISADGRRLSFRENEECECSNTFAVRVNLTVNATTGAISDPAPADFFGPFVPASIGGRGAIGDTDVRLSADGRYLLRITEYSGTTATTPPQFIDTVMVNDLNVDPNVDVATRVDFATPTTFVGDSGNTLEDLAISGHGRRIAFTEDPGVNGAPLVVHTVDRDPDGDGVLGPGVTPAVVSGNVSGTAVAARMPAFSSGVFTPVVGGPSLPAAATPADDGRYLAFVTDASVHNGLDDSSKTLGCAHSQSGVIEAFTEPLDSGAGPRMRLAADTGVSNCDVVVRDLVLDAQRAAAGLPRLPAELASPSQQPTLPGISPAVTCPTVCEGDGDSITPVLDADGSAAALTSAADNLLANGADNNNVGDVFKRSFRPTPSVPPADFGTVPVGDDTTVAVPVTTNGFGPLHITAVAIGGTNAGDFTVLPGNSCTNARLHETETCTVSIRFSPTAEGPRTGVLTVTPEGGSPVSGQLRGTGGPRRTPNFQATPDPLDFGSNFVDVPSAPRTVTVTNTGTAALVITAVAPIGNAPTGFPGDYTVDASNCLAGPVAPQGTCQVSVVFTARAVGNRPALLRFTDNASALPQVVALAGSGAPPAFQAAPDPLAFGTQQPFVPSAPKTVTVTNAGTGRLIITAVALGGTFPGDYAISANTCVGTVLAPGRTCTVSVTFAPQDVTDRPAQLLFTDNAAGSPHTVALTGNGTPPTLVVSPPLGKSGSVSQVSGTGWAPNKLVVVTLLNTPIQVSVTTSATGTFTVPLVIFPHTPLGQKQLRAQVQGIPQLTATVGYLVVPGSQLPPDFAERR